MLKIHFDPFAYKLSLKWVRDCVIFEFDLRADRSAEVLIDIDLVARSGGIRFLLHALGEGPVEVGPVLAATFLHIIDSPRTRAYLRLGTDLEVRMLLFSRFMILLYTIDCSLRHYRRLWQGR
jgi:hypothetical protein